MKISLIRHGESEANVGNYINDDPRRPVNLTGKGNAQAEALATALRGENFTCAYVSEFPRAQQTLNILLRDKSIPIFIDSRLNERKSGMDGQIVDLFNNQVKLNPLHFKTPDGESFIEQMGRLQNFLDEIALRHPDANVIAVAHENPILAALGLTTSAEEVVHAHLPNCGRIDLVWPPIKA